MITARILARTVAQGDCLIWQGWTMKNGYGRTSWNGKAWLVHRAIWTATYGPIPDGLTIDHLCRVRACVNVAHMEVVTPIENSRRAGGLDVAHARARARTHCKNGHEFTQENTYRQRGGYRGCRECNRQSWREWRDRARPKKEPRQPMGCPSRAAYVRHIKNGEDCPPCRAANAEYKRSRNDAGRIYPYSEWDDD